MLLLFGALPGCGVRTNRGPVQWRAVQVDAPAGLPQPSPVKHRARHVLYSIFWAPAPLEGANLQEQAYREWIARMNPSTADTTTNGIVAVMAADADPTACDPNDLDGDPNDDNCQASASPQAAAAQQQ